MVIAKFESSPFLKAKINSENSVLSAKIVQSTPLLKATVSFSNQILQAVIEKNTQIESYYETENEAGGTTVIIGD